MINSHTHGFLYLLLSEQSQPFENDSIAHLGKKDRMTDKRPQT